MRRERLILLVLLAVVVVASGCARKRTYYGPGGKVSVGGTGKSVEVQTGTGRATIDTEKKTITEEELGVPVYPGAKVELSGDYQGTGAGQGGMQQHMLTTPDDFDKVVAFYKSNLKNVKNSVNQDMGNSKMAMFTTTSAGGADITVHIMTDAQKKITSIQVLSMQKPKP